MAIPRISTDLYGNHRKTISLFCFVIFLCLYPFITLPMAFIPYSLSQESNVQIYIKEFEFCLWFLTSLPKYSTSLFHQIASVFLYICFFLYAHWWLITKPCLTLVTAQTVACQAPLSQDFPGKNTGVCCHIPLQ